MATQQDVGEGGEQHQARQTAEHDPNDARQKHYTAQIQNGAFRPGPWKGTLPRHPFKNA